VIHAEAGDRQTPVHETQRGEHGAQQGHGSVGHQGEWIKLRYKRLVHVAVGPEDVLKHPG